MDERLQKQLDFALEIDKEKNIFRQTHLSGHGRNENDAEHAWHMAIMAYLLREYANERVNIERVMIMCLIHDIVEIDAGDTYAYDAEGLKTQKAREEAAKERIFSLLPDDQKKELSALFDEFAPATSASTSWTGRDRSGSGSSTTRITACSSPALTAPPATSRKPAPASRTSTTRSSASCWKTRRCSTSSSPGWARSIRCSPRNS